MFDQEDHFSVADAKEVDPGDSVATKPAKKSVTWMDRVENKSVQKCCTQHPKGDRPSSPITQAWVDSDWRRRPPTLQEISAAAREASNTLFLAESGYFYDTVSYTHLTLPTKRIV